MWWRALARTSPAEAAIHVVRRCAAGRQAGCRSHDAAAFYGPSRSFSSSTGRCAVCHPRPAASCTTLLMARRTQSSLQRLLEDPSDPYLSALQQFDLPRIAAIVEEGPAQTAVPAAFLQRLGLRADADAAAATRAQRAVPTPLVKRSASSSAEAVLQSLYAAGLERQHETEAVAAEELQSAQAAYDALPEEEKAALRLERVVSHLFDGVCAISAAIRIQAEDGSASPEERDAVFRVCERVMKAYEEGVITAERWAADFAAEMEELEVVWRHLGDPRPLPLKK
ncbi:hypothetical protein ABL78_4530 [Leptomonas seymouri]|uniref:Uncharacterized protein n=1 Tax=Leptomonas seymouri TaxID=5684 RepID=A0A0N1I6A6_LEPSE|nr:hypothetical protein ABL78_4530 [Leptomonas seymouri]|eukprot:KPI86414.1 hypothetical protein ABL78_4530 [Leptomonas seymouri]